MRICKLETKEFNFLEIYSCSVTKHVNKHATATVIGLMKDSEDALYRNLQTKSWETIYAYDAHNSKHVLFEGIIFDASVKVTGDVRIATIQLIGGSFLMDQNEITRSYQNVGVSYSAIIQEKFQHYDYYEGEISLITKSIIKDREKGEKSFQDISMSYKQVMESVADINSSVNISNTIVYPILKFMETPWEFVKRMSSRNGYCVYPDYIGGTDSIFIGLPNDRNSVKLTIAEYSFGLSSNFYSIRKYNKKIERDSYIYYRFQSTKYYRIGTEIELNGKIKYVYKIEGNYINSEFIFTYWIGKREIVNVSPIHNYNIVGRTILGKVIETSGQTVKVHLDIDKEQDKDKAYPYPWSPDSGNLMYCMPQIGTRVSLYYGDTDEHPGKLVHCVRTNGNSTKHFNNSQEKHFTTEHNKNMVLYTDKIEFSNDTKKNQKSHIWLTDQDCLEFKSDSIFDLIAKKKVEIKANNIKISAPLQINMIKPKQLVCAGSRKYTFFDAISTGIELSNDLNMVADSRVSMAPKGYHVYPRINDKPERYDYDKLIANIILGTMCTLAGVILVLGGVLVAGIASAAAAGTALVSQKLRLQAVQ